MTRSFHTSNRFSASMSRPFAPIPRKPQERTNSDFLLRNGHTVLRSIWPISSLTLFVIWGAIGAGKGLVALRGTSIDVVEDFCFAFHFWSFSCLAEIYAVLPVDISLFITFNPSKAVLQ